MIFGHISARFDMYDTATSALQPVFIRTAIKSLQYGTMLLTLPRINKADQP